MNRRKFWMYKKKGKIVKNSKGSTVSFQMISKERFALSLPSRAKDIKDKCVKVLENFEHFFDIDNNFYVLKIDCKEKLKKKLKSDVGITVKDIPNQVVEIFQNVDERDNVDAEIDVTSLPEKLSENLFPFQWVLLFLLLQSNWKKKLKESIIFAQKKKGKILLADEMGLGKTIQSIAIASVYSSEWPLLIIAPSATKCSTWQSELTKWLPYICENIPPEVSNSVDIDSGINVIKTGKGRVSSLVNVISFDLVPKLKEKISEMKFKVIIVDESHFLKNAKSLRCKAALPILKKAKRLILISGTPALNRPSELYSQLDALNKPIFSTFKQFGERYCNAFPGPYGQMDYSGSSNLKELHAILSLTMIRRFKKDILTSLPPKNRHKVEINADLDQLNEAKEVLENAKIKKKTQNQNDIMTLFNLSAKAKINGAIDYVLDLCITNKKFLVFAHHLEMLDSLENAVQQNQIKYLRIDGSTSATKKSNLIEKFQNTTECIALLSITAAGTGITLNTAHTVVFTELFWSPGVLIQCEDRVHRIGQKNECEIIYLYSVGTVDELIWPLIEKKLEVVGKTLNGEEEFLDLANLIPDELLSSLPNPNDVVIQTNNLENQKSKKKKNKSNTKKKNEKKEKKQNIPLELQNDKIEYDSEDDFIPAKPSPGTLELVKQPKTKKKQKEKEKQKQKQKPKESFFKKSKIPEVIDLIDSSDEEIIDIKKGKQKQNNNSLKTGNNLFNKSKNINSNVKKQQTLNFGTIPATKKRPLSSVSFILPESSQEPAKKKFKANCPTILVDDSSDSSLSEEGCWS